MKTSRPSTRAGASLLLLALLSSCSPPPRGYECISPGTPGGGWDLTCRTVSQVLNQAAIVSRPIRVTNLPGAGGGIAFANVVADRSRDGSVIVAASPATTLRLAEKQFGRFEVDDVRWVGAVAADYGVVAVGKNAPWGTLSDLMAEWKENPSRVIAAGGSPVGGQDHMRMLLLADVNGIDLKRVRYVPFDGGGESLTALLGGFVHVMPGDASEVLSQYRAGNVRLLAVLSDRRLEPPLDAVPTAREQGFDVEWIVWRGFYAPSEIAEEDYAHWVAALSALADSPEWAAVRERYGFSDFRVVGDDFERLVRKQVGEFGRLLARLGLVR